MDSIQPHEFETSAEGRMSGPPTFAHLSPGARAVWAKSGVEGGHGLLAHMLDAAAVAERIASREPSSALEWAANELGLPVSSEAARMLGYLVGLHDIGKATIGFQRKWDAGLEADLAAGLPFPRRLHHLDRHDVSTAHIAAARIGEQLAGTVAAHHGFHFLPRDLWNARLAGEPREWIQARDEILDRFAAALDIRADALDASRQYSPGFCEWLAGLTSTSDWIASSTLWFPLGERAGELKNHHRAALALADRALDGIGWPDSIPLLGDFEFDVTALLRRMSDGAIQQPRPLQAVSSALLERAIGPSLVIVEAPMGEGKTEFAFLAHLLLQRANGHRGFYVALPTQATGNAMFDRGLQFLQAFSAGQRLDLQLVHGTAMLDDRLVLLRGIGDPQRGTATEDIRSSEWFSQRRRALLSPYGVGTIDQALYATLNVKHHFVRLWGLANKVVILDEVHAYDTYTGGLLEALIRWLKTLGCSVVLMSATLPRERREALARAWDPSATLADDLPYPRTSVISRAGSNSSSYAARELPAIQVSGMDEDTAAIAGLVLDEIREGGCAAIIANTVDRAQEIYRRLKDGVDDSTMLLLFHARYPAAERAGKERQVLQHFGQHGVRPARAILVATQVAEQSLDIDFDLMVSDLAPVDLLLQRAGRLHRHGRSRPSRHAVPRMVVAGLQRGAFPNLEETAWAYVYDAYLLGRTWAFASREQTWSLPGDIDRLVQLVYGDAPLPDELGSTERERIDTIALGQHLAEDQTLRQFAANAAIDARIGIPDAYVGKPHGREAGEALGSDNRTRFGAESVNAVPIYLVDGEWRLELDGQSLDPGSRPDDATARRILSRVVRLSRLDVRAQLVREDPPRGWSEHPWLSDLRPLCLIDGQWHGARTTIRLDAELGVIYERRAGPLEPAPKEGAL
jgi:CRISPR-associated endonuclease/helicase Cas3